MSLTHSCILFHWNFNSGWAEIAKKNLLSTTSQPLSPVRYAKFESIRYFIDIDILQSCLIDIDIDIFQNHHIDIDIDIDIFGIALSISISISIFFRIALSISISISIFSTSPYRYWYRYQYFSKVSIYRQSICHIDISNRAKYKRSSWTSKYTLFCVRPVLPLMCEICLWLVLVQP